MFQAINDIRPYFIRFLSILLLVSGTLYGAPPTEEVKDTKNCSLLEKGVPEEYLLSRGFQEQVDAFQSAARRKPEEAKKQHEAAVGFFEKYHNCRKEKNEEPTFLSAYSIGVSYLELGELDLAMRWSETAYKKFQPPNPPSRESILLKTRVEIRKGELETASDTLEKDLKDYPYDSDFLYLLGNLNFELKRWTKSVLYYTSLWDLIQKRDTNSKYKSTVLKSLGELNYKLDNPKKSLYYYLAYLDLARNDTEVIFRVAQINYLLGDFSNTKKYLNWIRESNPREIDASHMLGEIYFLDSRVMAPGYFVTLAHEKKIPKEGLISILDRFLKGRKQGLADELSSFIEKNPGRLAARVAYQESVASSEKERLYKAMLSTAALAFQYRQYVVSENAFNSAIRFAEKEEGLAGDIPGLLERVSHCEEAMGYPNSAILSVKKAILTTQSEEERNNLKFRLAYLLLNPSIKNYDASLAIGKFLLEKEPKNAAYYYLQGLVYFQKEDYKQSLANFSKAVELEPQNNNYLFYRATVFDKLKNFPKTETDLLASIQTNPENPNAYNYLGYLYAERGIKKEEALSYLRKAVDLEPDNAAYQDSLGWIYFKTNQWKEALLHLHFAEQISVNRDAEDPVIFDHLGDVYLAKKDLVKAGFYWQMALPLTKDDMESSKIKTKLTTVQKELAE
ncbi:hypothetical protein LPTSP3_g22480 [Leptospira kobayashii]|uniref:Tetratricopeptide repeat protein n=1 Tax=Leptospira kobayashii TaxID=1917830 RepID=A0ABN6KE56_9LEPT|nr:tetratricopeptide repeat protein [Leptospira kobayashii]BDA79318.1 hypothetical protein LPTSP3_g22480 [Leptospira kobayashii]